VNYFPYISSPADHERCTRFWRALRRGEFPLAFAEIYADSGVERRELVKIGAEIEGALLRRGDNEAKGNRLGRIAVRVSRLLGTGSHDETAPQRELVDTLFQWAHERRGLSAWNPKSYQLLTIGYIVGAATRAIAISVALGEPYEAALAKVENNPDWLADMAFAAIRGHGLAISITDVRDTICYGMTAHGRLEDWLLPEKIESAVKDEADQVARFLKVAAPELCGMSAAELPSRIFDTRVERWRHGANRQRRPCKGEVMENSAPLAGA
jgi:hypothetical protein